MSVYINSSSSAGVTSGTYASRPAAGTVGRIYIPTDGFCSYYDTGSVWQPLIQGVAGTQPDEASTFTATNASATSALADNNGTLVASDDTLTNTLPDYAIWTKTLGGLTTVEGVIWQSPSMTTWNGAATSYTFGGLVLRESATGKLALIMLSHTPGGFSYVSCEYATSATTGRTVIGGEITKYTTHLLSNSQIYLRVRQDGATIRYEYSVGRTQWTAIATIATTTAFTTAPDQYGLVVWPYNNNNPSSARIVVPHLAIS